MAKEKKETTPVVITPENIVEQRMAGNILTPELRKKMEEENKEQKDKNIIRETNRRISYIGFRFDSGMVELKRMRAMEGLALYNTRQQGRLMRFLTGFVATEQIISEYAAKTEDDVLKLEKADVKAGTITILIPETDKNGKVTTKEMTFKAGDEVPAVIDYFKFDEGLEILKKNIKDRQDAIEKQYVDDMTIIKKAAGEYWQEDWRYAVRVISSTGAKESRY